MPGFVGRRFIVLCFSAAFLIAAFRQLGSPDAYPLPPPTLVSSREITQPVDWKHVHTRYPVTSMRPLPSGSPFPIPRIQYEFGVETEQRKQKRKERRAAVKEAFLHSWNGYKKYAWLQDEVEPLSGGYKNGFGGRGATLVDALDTLLIMGLDAEFESALSAVKTIDFTTSGDFKMNVFETTIRYLGGLLGAYDLSEKNHRVLLEKAVQLGDMLYGAFDTPNRLPITRWDWENGALGGAQTALSNSISSEIGSLSLEFTRLSQLTNDPKYFDAIQRITDLLDAHQLRNDNPIPGLFPTSFNAEKETFTSGRKFTLGSMVDSLYEYFPKQHMLLGGMGSQYQVLYERAIDAAKTHLFFRPLTPQNEDILVSGYKEIYSAGSEADLVPKGQHLACFVGGMVGIGAKIFKRTGELDIAKKLTDGCIWAYDSMASGIMPEEFELVPCSSESDSCEWSEERWHDAVVRAAGTASNLNASSLISEHGLLPGYTGIEDRRYLLRPEAIESVFIMYRITGDQEYQEAAWRMFSAIKNATYTDLAHASIMDVTRPREEDHGQIDSMESFWLGETLKYFYLIFSEPDVVSLDDYVFNTEAHPLRRPQKE